MSIIRPDFISFIQNKVGASAEEIQKNTIAVPTGHNEDIEAKLPQVAEASTHMIEQADAFQRSFPPDQQNSFGANLGNAVFKLRTKALAASGGPAFELYSDLIQSMPQLLGRTIAPKNFESAPDPNARRGRPGAETGIFKVDLQDRNDETAGQYNDLRVGVLFVDTTPGEDGAFIYLHKDPPPATPDKKA